MEKGVDSKHSPNAISERLKAVAINIRDCQKSSTPSVSLSTVKELFELVPDLDSIQKDARQRVVSQIIVKEMLAGDILIKEDDTLKEFYLVVEGVLLQIPKGQKVDAKVGVFQYLTVRIESSEKPQQGKGKNG